MLVSEGNACLKQTIIPNIANRNKPLKTNMELPRCMFGFGLDNDVDVDVVVVVVVVDDAHDHVVFQRSIF